MIRYTLQVLFIVGTITAFSAEEKCNIKICDIKMEISQEYMLNITPKWESFINTGRCLISAISVKFSTEGSAFESEAWKSISDSEITSLFKYLCLKSRSSKETKVHVCGLENATEGVLAIYCLQQIVGKDWTEYNGDNEKLLSLVKQCDVPTAWPAALLQAALKEVIASPQCLDELLCFFYKNGVLYKKCSK